MPKDSLYFSNFTRSGLAFFQYLTSLCSNLPIYACGHDIQTRLRTITVVRNPMDVIPSSVINNWQYRQDAEETMSQGEQLYVDFYKKLMNQDNLIVIDFNDLIEKPEKTFEAIHKLLDIEFVMQQRDINKTFNEGRHLHTSKTHPEYDRIKALSDKKDYSFSLAKMNKILLRKLEV